MVFHQKYQTHKMSCRAFEKLALGWLGSVREGRDDSTKPGSLGWKVTKEFSLHLWRSGKGFPDVSDSQWVPRLLVRGEGATMQCSWFWCHWCEGGGRSDGRFWDWTQLTLAGKEMKANSGNQKRVVSSFSFFAVFHRRLPVIHIKRKPSAKRLQEIQALVSQAKITQSI